MFPLFLLSGHLKPRCAKYMYIFATLDISYLNWKLFILVFKMYTYEIVLVDWYAYSVLIIRYWLFIIIFTSYLSYFIFTYE